MTSRKDVLADLPELNDNLGLMLLVLFSTNWTRSNNGPAKRGNWTKVAYSWNWYLSLMTDIQSLSDGTPSPIVTLVGYKFGEKILTLTLDLSSPAEEAVLQKLLSRPSSNIEQWKNDGNLFLSASNHQLTIS